jgi:glucose-1-phosphatase
VAKNIAHPLIAEIGSELKTPGRTFTFLCGHDSNIASVLGALDAEPYELEGSIEAGTPIGGKVVFERWADAQGEQYGRVRLIYASAEQLRSATLLVGDNQPMAYELSFEGLEKNADGLYAYQDLEDRIQSATDAYDEIVATYQDQAEAA